MKYAYVYALFWMLVFHTSCGGQNQTNPPQDNSRKAHNGLSESQLKEYAASKVPMAQVRNIKQARNGDILIAASWSGVFRYDGKSFTNLTGSKIGSHRFWDVLEDRHGNLWFASIDSGVYYYNGKSFQHFTTREGLGNNILMSIYEDKAGNIWFSGGGLSRYDGRSFQNFTTKDGLPDNGGGAIMEDKTGKLWIATGDGPCFYDGKTFTVLKNKDGKAFKNVWPIIEDKKGNIWTTGGVNSNVWALSRYDAKSLYNKMPTVTEIKSGPPAFLGLLEANDGSIWFGSGSGVYRYDGKTFTDFKSAAGQK
jgi:ligand-binding sensor domain-containing protein